MVDRMDTQINLLSKVAEELHSTDNALVEGKNGAIIRKHMGHGHIPGEHAMRIRTSISDI